MNIIVQSVFTLSPLSCVIILFCTLLLVFGAKESSTFNVIITVFNLTLIAFIIILGGIYSKKENLINFFPNGFRGVFTGRSLSLFLHNITKERKLLHKAENY
jgi:APA family basic amino acid/polyamine antiporter